MKFFWYTFLIFCNLWGVCLWGQTPTIKFKHLTIEDGLSHSWVHAICQDKYGFMWIGTDDGLNRFDGYDFRVYKNNLRNSSTISSNTIYSLYEDKSGHLWVGTSNGLNLYDAEKDQFIHKDHWPKNVINTITEDDLHNLWIATSVYLYYYNIKNDSLTVYKPLNDSHGIGQKDIGRISSAYVLLVFVDSRKNVWVGTNCGLNLFNKETKTFTNYYHRDNDSKSLGNDNISYVFEDHSGRLWIGTYGGLELFTNSKYCPKTGIFEHWQHDKKNSGSIGIGSVLSILEDNKSRLWIANENGGISLLDIKNFDSKNCRFIHYQNDPNNANSLNHNSIYTLFQDKQSNIWIGTYGNGINIYSGLANKFAHLTSDLNNKTSINNNQVNTLLEDGDFIWIGTEGGLNCYNKKDGTFKYFVNNTSDKSSLSSNAVWSLFKDSHGDLWVGTWAGGLNKFNYKTQTFTHYFADPKNKNGLNNNNIFSIKEDKQGNLWIGTIGGGLNRLDADRKKFTSFTKSNSGIYADYIESIIETKNGDLWFIDLNSVNRYDYATKKFENYINKPKDTTSLRGNKIFSMYEDSKGNLWVGTDAGFNLFQKSINGFICYSTEQGSADNSVKSIVEDNHGNLWFGTNKGISCALNAINLPPSLKYENYTEEDGLQGKEFTKRSCLKTSSGLIYFGGVNGLNIFNPDSVKDNPSIPNVVITDFLIFNKSANIGSQDSPLKQNLLLTKEIVLNHQQSVISFKFAALNYISTQKNQYAYRMEGFEKDWNYVGSKREATYTNLNPGEYTFHVKASNNDGVWNEKGITLKIKILPPWWETIWFRFIVIMSVISFITLFFYFKIEAYTRRQKELTELVNQRTHELKDINAQLLKEQVVIVEQQKILKLANSDLQEKNQRIKEYVNETSAQNEELKLINEQLLEKQTKIEEQTEELSARSENLKEVNELLVEKQNLIQMQAKVLEESNRELSLINSTKDKLFSIIAHDLRNPFHAVSGFSEILKREYEKLPKEKIEKYLDIINRSSAKGNDLLENLLNWSRAQTGRIVFEPVHFDLFIVSKEITDLLEIDAQGKNIQQIVEVEPGLMVFADENMVKTVLRNLISNAIKFTANKGKITIQALKHETHVEVSIVDTGVGIPAKNIKLLFNVDTNISTKGTTSEPGTGLGLILCKDFIVRNNGKIWVESELGKGSKFKFTLPLA